MKTMKPNQLSKDSQTKEPSIKQEAKANIRQALISHRGKLSAKELSKASQDLKNSALLNQELQEIFLNAQNILSYLAVNGEISPDDLTEKLLAKLYLPKIVNYENKQMHFFPADQALVKNRYGIFEPIGTGQPLELANFDVILVPLVAFDLQGNRIGMGGGFYDKAISASKKKPLLIGLAHEFQMQKSLQPDAWDVRLDVILTDQEIFDPANKLSN